MAKNHTFPILFDEVKSFSITDLKKLNYLQENKSIKATIKWIKQGENSGSINIKTSLVEHNNFIELIYNYNDKPYNYKVYLTSTNSNLGKGKIWYFKCKYTGARCRKLHLLNGLFQHRSILKKGMYSTQIQSKYYRTLEKTFGAYFKSETYFSQLNSRYFKQYYKGKPTKRYLKLTEQIQKGESTKLHDIEKHINTM